ncbi:MAG TPA: hypothetical protein DHN33_04235 [Eubacteriaceae bacterium]|nr:hypothetical protein [Eubacteriaceae bacterium]
MKNKKILSLIPIVFFILGFVHIAFAWLGLLCMILPFVLLFRDRKKTWCQGVCPRMNLFQQLFKNRKPKKLPKWMKNGNLKKYVLIYFMINLTIMILSTLMVGIDRIMPMDQLRFMVLFPIPIEMPQLFEFVSAADWAVHLSYRIYSMMFTSVAVGFALAYLYMPRAWCTICPVNTASGMILKEMKKENSRPKRQKGFESNSRTD